MTFNDLRTGVYNFARHKRPDGMLARVMLILYYFARHNRHRLMFMLHAKYFCDFSFIHINKTGGSSIEQALGIPLIHETALTFRNLIGVERWEKQFSFAIVRNPWDRVISQFHYRKEMNETGLRDLSLPFKDWVRLVFVEQSPVFRDEEKLFLPQVDWVCDEQGQIIVDYIGRFEDLQQAWNDICEHLKREKTTLPHVKKSSRGDYRNYYDDETRDIIGEYFQRDLEYFGYTFE